MTQVETLIADGGYDYELSMNALVNHAQSSAGYDVTDKQDFNHISKLLIKLGYTQLC